MTLGRFAESLKEVQEVMQASEDELSSMMGEMAGPSTSGMMSSHPPKLLELISILQQDPMLIPPMLEIARMKQAQIADAKGRILYGDEEWNRMLEQARQQNSPA